MADASISLGTVDLLGLGAPFEPISANYTGAGLISHAPGNTGLSLASSRITSTTVYNQAYTYCGNNLRADLGTIATQFGGVVYSVQIAGYISIRSIAITYSAANYPVVIFVGHNHTTNPHTTATNTTDASAAIPASGFGVPDFGVTSGVNASPIFAGLQLQKGHYDIQNADGSHLHGGNTKECELVLSVEYVGIPTSKTADALEADLSAITGFSTRVSSTDESTQNTSFNSYSYVAEGLATA